ncbi:MAG: peptidyl-prolyl cis-trans isomerase [Gammaproteobacteria bacterium]|nr:peptidyl-prolyl cis-trans isomerase [Gammaproteobacteria bacterium]
MISKILREPFFHFLVIGTLLFVLYELTRSDSDRTNDDVISISTQDIEGLQEQWLRQHGEEANQDTLSELIESLVYQEVMFREASRLGLDINDTIIRRRLVQKMEFLSSNLAQLRIPDESSLLAYYDENSKQYAIEEKRSFTHIYFSRDRRGERMLDDASRLLEEIKQSESSSRLAEQGDNFILQYDYNLRSVDQVARIFGESFAKDLFELPAAKWQGPLLSEYGAHLIRIHSIQPAHVPAFAAVKDKVYNDLTRESLQKLKDESYQALRETYQVRINTSLPEN